MKYKKINLNVNIFEGASSEEKDAVVNLKTIVKKPKPKIKKANTSFQLGSMRSIAQPATMTQKKVKK